MNAKISIIVPCYNVELYIEKCVNSVIGQTASNWELILVDDGSRDQTPVLCDQFALRDKRIKVVHKNNGGLVSSRNVGFEHASGDWLMYVDGDDWISLDTIEVLNKAIELYPKVDVFFWNNVQELGEQSLVKEKWHCEENFHVYQKDECMELARNVLVYSSNIASACPKLVKKTFAKQYNLKHNVKLSQGVEGVEYCLRLFAAARSAVYINQFLYHYRYNPTSISKRIDEKNTKNIYDGFNECLKFIDDTIEDKRHFMTAFYDRVIHAIIAVSMSTYFHPHNAGGIFLGARKFSKIAKWPLFKETISNTKLSSLDKKRGVVLLMMKLHLYILIAPVAYLKYFMLKRGYFNY